MQYISIGETIRNKRIAHGLTQEELADNICSVGYLSKIENSTKQPSKKKLRMLLERLGETLTVTADVTEKVEDFRYNVLRLELMRAIERHNVLELEEKLWVMKKLLNEEDVNDLQFYKMSYLVWEVMCGVKVDDYETKAYQIWCMCRGEDDIIKGFNLDRMNLTEMWILSNVATGFAWKNYFETAARIYLRIYCAIQEQSGLETGMYKTKAIMCNNIAVCMIHLKRYTKAKEFCDYGMKNANYDGGCMLLLHLMRVDMEIHKRRGQQREADETGYLISVIYNKYLETGEEYTDRKDKDIADVLWEHQLIMSI